MNAVLANQLRLQRLTVAVWAVLLGFMSLAVASSAPAVVQNIDAIEEMIGPYRSFLRIPNSMPYPADTFIQMKLLSFAPLLIGFMAAVSSLGILCKEVDRGTVDFVYTLPLRRRSILINRFLGIAISIFVLHVVACVTLVASLVSFRVEASYVRYILAFAVSACLDTTIAAIVLAVSVFIDDLSRGIRMALAIVLSLFAVDVGATVLSGVGFVVSGRGALATFIGWVSLFGLYDSGEIINTGRFPIHSILAFGIITVASIGFAVKSAESKQMSG